MMAGRSHACWGEVSDLVQNRGLTTTTAVAVSWTNTYSGSCSPTYNIKVLWAAPADRDSGDQDCSFGGCTSSYLTTGWTPGHSGLVRVKGRQFNSKKTIVTGTFHAACPLGTEFNGVSGCNACDIGSFRDNEEFETPCTACGGGQTTAAAGAVSGDDECGCQPGYVWDTVACVSCPSGYYKPSFGKTGCEACPLAHQGSSSFATSSSSCFCLPGAELVGSNCELCPVGEFKTSLSNGPCMSCGAGLTTAAEGATSSSACVCGPGYAGSGTSCTRCPVGSYSNTTQQSSCTPCPPGFTTADTGAESVAECDRCVSGRYGLNCSGVCACGPGETCLDGINGNGLCSCGATGLAGPLCDQCPFPVWYGPACNETVDCQNGGTPSFGFGGTGVCASCLHTRWSHAIDPTCATCAPQNYGPDCLFCPPGWAAPTGAACAECAPGTMKDGTSAYAACSACPAGYAQPAAAATSCNACDQGTYAEGGAVTCLPCGAGMTTAAGAAVSAGDCVACPVNTFKSAAGAGTCLPCTGNSTTNARVGAVAESDCGCGRGFELMDGTCKGCAPGFWSAAWSTAPCAFTEPGTVWLGPTVAPGLCPFGGLCAGGTSKPVSAPGFHPEDPTSDAFVACSPVTVCLVDNHCRRGHTGDRCGVCDPGWVKDPSTGLCSECPANVWLIFLAIFVIGGVLAVVVVRIARANAALFTAATIGFNYVQIVSVLSSFNLPWPTWVQSFFELLSAANLDLQLFKPECLVSDSQTAYTTVWLAKILAPWVMLAFLALVLAVIHLWALVTRSRAFRTCTRGNVRRVSAASLAETRYAVTAASTLAILALYLMVTTAATEIFPCRKAADGRLFMVREPSITCYSARWLRLLAGSLVTLLVFSLLLPTLAAILMYRRRFNLWKRKNNVRFGILFLKYRPGYFLWELNILARKAGVVAGKVFFSQIVVGQVVTAGLVVAASLAAQVRASPYATQRINRLEGTMLTCATAVLAAAVLYAVSDGAGGGTFADVLGGFLVTLICATLILLVIAIFLEVRKVLRLKKRGLGGHAVDRLDVWSPFFVAGLRLTAHTQQPSAGEASVIRLAFESDTAVRVLAQLELEQAFVTRAEREVDARSCAWMRIGDGKSAESHQPSAQSSSSADMPSRHHELSLTAPVPGYYVAVLAVDAGDSVGGGPAPPPSIFSRAFAQLFGSPTPQALAPELVRAIMVSGAERALSFRITASPEWRAVDALAAHPTDADDAWVAKGDADALVTINDGDAFANDDSDGDDVELTAF